MQAFRIGCANLTYLCCIKLIRSLRGKCTDGRTNRKNVSKTSPLCMPSIRFGNYGELLRRIIVNGLKILGETVIRSKKKAQLLIIKSG